MFSSAALISFGLLLTPFARAAIHDVTVGGANGTLTYSPEAIFASQGDQVVFHFQQKNHTVSQSSFADPCGLKAGGFDSGFMPVAANVTDNFPTYTITVNDTNPIWVYCAQAANTAASHCGQGMVFAVNCGADGSNNSFTDFKNSALAIGAQLAAAASSTAASPYAYGSSSTASATVSAVTDAPSSTPVTTTGTSTAAVTTHTVVVGGGGNLTFSPDQLSAQVNDVVVFSFVAKNHTVTQSSFPAPCQKLAPNATTGQAGFDSGFMPVAANSTDFPTYSLTINDTNPIWAYCRQTNPSSHCGAGMVLAINSVESSSKNFSAFQALAIQLNGTANSTSTNSTNSSSPSSSSTSDSAPRYRAGLGLGLAAIGVVYTVF